MKAFPLAFAVLALLFMPSMRAWADDCGDLRGDAAIAACTAHINSGKFKGRDLAIKYTNRGSEYDEKKDYDRAIADYDQAIRIDARYSAAYINRGASYYKKGDNDRAIADYDRAINIDPKVAKAYYNRGNAYDAKANYDAAIADYNRAISLDPEYLKAYNNRCYVYNKLLDFERAIADCNRALRINPRHASAYNNRAESYLEKGDFDAAITDYNQAIDIDPAVAGYYLDRGRAYERKGNPAQAIADFDRAISIDPKNSEAYFQRALIHLYNNALQKALADLTQSSAMDPKAAYSALWLDIARQRSNVPSELGPATESLDMSSWPAPVIRLYLGQTEPERVRATAENSDNRNRRGRICEANFYIGVMLLRKGSKEEAAKLFSQALNDCPRGFIEWGGANAELKALRAPSGEKLFTILLGGLVIATMVAAPFALVRYMNRFGDGNPVDPARPTTRAANAEAESVDALKPEMPIVAAEPDTPIVAPEPEMSAVFSEPDRPDDSAIQRSTDATL